jgi:ribosomal protein S18 acetylase RimI-like enzyme
MTLKASFHPTLLIRQANPGDAELLAELGSRTFVETFAVDDTPKDMAAYLKTSFSPALLASELADPRVTVRIAEIDHEAVGYAMLRSGPAPESLTSDNPIELVRLYVSRESLGSGIGAALMQDCIDQAKQKNFETLWLGVWENNTRAQAFYRKWSFREVGTHPFQLGDDTQTDLLMQRSISEEPA